MRMPGSRRRRIYSPSTSATRASWGWTPSICYATSCRARRPARMTYRSARLMLEWQVESQAGRVIAPLEEREIAWEAEAIVEVPDRGPVPYQRVPIELANLADRRARLALDEARAVLVERELVPIRRERLQGERNFIEGLQLASDYNATFTLLSGIDLSRLIEECRRCLADTRAMWDDLLPEAARRVLGVPVSELTRSDALALLRGSEFDAYFPAREMEAAIRRQVGDMGIDPVAGGRIRYDVGEREGKRSRAFCAPVRVPDEVYLVLRPHGGQTDYQTLLHELGHALHFAYTRPDYPFEYRWVGDNSVTEGYAMLFDHLMQTSGWLLRYSTLGTPSAASLLAGGGARGAAVPASLLCEADLRDGAVRVHGGLGGTEQPLRRDPDGRNVISLPRCGCIH